MGYAYAHRYQERAAYGWDAELSIYLAPERVAKGLGKRLYGALMEILRLQGVCSAFARVTLPNPASEGLHRAMGFERVGDERCSGFKDGRWHSMRIYQKQLGRWDAPPQPLKPVSSLNAGVVERVLKAYGE